MGERVNLTAADGHRLGGWLAVPEGTARGGVVVIQEAFGVNDYIRSVCARYATEGYASLAPALYDRQERDVDLGYEPAFMEHGRRLRAGLVWEDVQADVQAAVGALRGFGRVGIVGYCVGGSVAWLAASVEGLAAASAYYGRDIVDFLDRPPHCPTMLHFGVQDHMIPQGDVQRIAATYPALPVFVYEAGHGFDRFGEAPALLARQRTLQLFRAEIG